MIALDGAFNRKVILGAIMVLSGIGCGGGELPARAPVQACAAVVGEGSLASPVTLTTMSIRHRISFPRILSFYGDRVYVSRGYVQSHNESGEPLVHRWCWTQSAGLTCARHHADVERGAFFDLMSGNLFVFELDRRASVATVRSCDDRGSEFLEYVVCDPDVSQMCPRDPDELIEIVDGSPPCRDVISFRPSFVRDP